MSKNVQNVCKSEQEGVGGPVPMFEVKINNFENYILKHFNNT